MAIALNRIMPPVLAAKMLKIVLISRKKISKMFYNSVEQKSAIRRAESLADLHRKSSLKCREMPLEMIDEIRRLNVCAHFSPPTKFVKFFSPKNVVLL